MRNKRSREQQNEEQDYVRGMEEQNEEEKGDEVEVEEISTVFLCLLYPCYRSLNRFDSFLMFSLRFLSYL